METLLRWRRDVRHFDRRPIPETALEDLLATAILAPSVGNAQPWRFVQIRSDDRRETLAWHVDAHVAAAGTGYEAERRTRYDGLKLHGLREAPVLLAVYCDEHPAAGHGLGAATMAETLRYSCVMAIHTLWLAARARGIGLGWVSILDPADVTRILDVPTDWTLIGLLCLGYPADRSTVPELERHGWQAREGLAGKLLER